MISVCVASYNGAQFIKEQVESILSQLSPEDEVVVSDDGSIDNTCDILLNLNDNRIKLFHNTGEKGVNGNFENALIHSKGDIIFLSDQDDVWLPGKVKECVNALSEYDCIVHDAFIVDTNLNIIKDSFFQSVNAQPGFVHNWIRNGHLGCAMAFRRKILDDCLPIPSNLPVWHDMWIGLISNVKYRVAFIPFKGILFRRHSANTSVTSKSRFSLKKQISYRIKLLPLLIKRIVLNK